MEEPFFSVVRLPRSPARRRHFLYAAADPMSTEDSSRGCGFSSSGAAACFLSAPSSPARTRGGAYYLSPELEEAVSFGEVCAAIPFSWEEIPGTPLRNLGGSKCNSEGGEIDDQAFGGSFFSSSSETAAARVDNIESSLGSTAASDRFSHSTDSEFESPAGVDAHPASAGGMSVTTSSGECSSSSSRSVEEAAAGFEFKSDQPRGPVEAASSSPAISAASPPSSCMSTPDELFFKWRPVPILSLPPRLQRGLDQVSQTPSCNDSPAARGSSVAAAGDSISNSSRSSACRTWTSFNKQYRLTGRTSPFASSPAPGSPAAAPRSPCRRSGTNTKKTSSKPAAAATAASSILMNLFGTVSSTPRSTATSSNSENQNILDSSSNIISISGATELQESTTTGGRRLDRRGHVRRLSRSVSPKSLGSTFKRGEMFKTNRESYVVEEMQAEASTKKSGTKSSSCDSSFWSSTTLFGKNQKRSSSSTMSSITQLLRPSIFTTSPARREAAASVSPRIHEQYETVTSPATASSTKSNLPTQNFSKDPVEMTKSSTAAKKQQQQSSSGIINSSHSNNSPKEMNLKSKLAAAGEYLQADHRGGVRFMFFFRKVANKSSSSS